MNKIEVVISESSALSLEMWEVLNLLGKKIHILFGHDYLPAINDRIRMNELVVFPIHLEDNEDKQVEKLFASRKWFVIEREFTQRGVILKVNSPYQADNKSWKLDQQ